MPPSRRTPFTLSALVLAFLVTVSAQAANRVFLGLSGNNANDCSNPATPCFSFGGAMAQVAAGGEVIVEATGGYGLLDITQAVSINAAAGVVAFSAIQVSVNAPGATVVLRGLTIDGRGSAANGINVVAVGVLQVENCVITGFTGNDSSHGNGIFFGSSGNLFVKDTLARGNGNVGIWVQPTSGTAKASIDHCRLEGNQYGVDSAGSSTFTTTRDSVASGNPNTGFLAEIGGELNIENCLAANNGNGIASQAAGSLARVSNSTVTDNTTGVIALTGGTVLTRGNNTVEGNTTDGSFTGSFLAK